MSTRAEFFQSMYPGLSDGEVIDELIKASIYVFEHGPEVVTISAAEGIHYVPYDAAMQKKSLTEVLHEKEEKDRNDEHHKVEN